MMFLLEAARHNLYGAKIICLVYVVVFMCHLSPTVVYASSDRAYQDYLFQADVYRQKYNDFSIAKSEYLKFKTLASEATAILKTREMLSQRSDLLRAYLLLLTEKINEATTMSSSDRQLFQSFIINEVAFLETHSKFVESIATIKDAIKANDDLASHYLILATSIRQIILGLTVARLTELEQSYSNLMIHAQIQLNTAKNELSLERQQTLDRWFQRISDKRTIFLQKVEGINATRATLKSNKVEDLQKEFEKILPLATQARQELKEGTSYLEELLHSMRYKN